MAFKERIKEIRKSLGYTQKEMAEEFGIGYRTLQRYEDGADFPAGIFLIEIAMRGYNLDWVLTGDGEKERGPKKYIRGPLEEWIRDMEMKNPDFYSEFMTDCAAIFPDFAEWLKKRKTGKTETNLASKNVA